MKTETKSTEKILVRIADKLSEAQQEIDALAVQLALGKAEAKDKFEELKKEFRIRLNEFKQYLVVASSDIELIHTRTIIEDLEKDLDQGEVDNKEAFASQQKDLLNSTNTLQNALEKKSGSTELHDFMHDIEKFKIKLEILRLKFGLKKMEIKDEFKGYMDDARKYIDKIRERITSGKEKYEDFREEIQQAYKHFRKALKEL